MPPNALHLAGAAALSIVALVPAIGAETLTYGIDAGVGETDNVTLAHAARVNQTLAVADADLDYIKQSSHLDVNAKGNFSYLDYLQGAYHNQLLGRFDGTVDVAVIPERLKWVVQDNYGQSTIDPFTPNTPTNVESINNFSTGPELSLRFGIAFLNLGARVARAQYETSPLTNDRASINLEWGRELSARSSVSLNADGQRILFENTIVNSDFERSNVFARYSLDGNRTKVSADLGVTQVDEDGVSTHGALVSAVIDRQLSAAAKLTMTIGRRLTDATSSFSNLQSGALGVVGIAPAAVTSQNYTRNYASIGWQCVRNRTSVGVSSQWEKDLYTSPLLDRKLVTAEFRVQRRLTRTTSVRLFGRLYQSDYVDTHSVGVSGSPNSSNALVGGAISWHHGRALEVRLQAEHTAYTTSPNDLGYAENRIFVTVGYRPLLAQRSSDEMTTDGDPSSFQR